MSEFTPEEQQSIETARAALAAALRHAPVPDHPTASAFEVRDLYERRLIALNSAWRRCGIGVRHGERIRNECTGWAKLFDRIKNTLGTGFIYCLIGARGTGKTKLAAELCRVVIERKALCYEPVARYVTAANLFMQIRGSFIDASGKAEVAVLREYASLELLVIDEVQERSGSDFEARILNLLVDERYANKKDTLLISNLSAEDVPALLGACITSRMNECGGVLATKWPSFRGVTRDNHEES